MGERGWIASGWIAITSVALAAMLLPAAAAAHPAYVDAEFSGTSDSQCAFPQETPEHGGPCKTIAAAAPFVESGLAVLVDDSSSPYSAIVTDWQPLAPPGFLGIGALVANDFAPETLPGATEWTIDGGSGTAVTVPDNEATTISGFALRGDTSGVTVNGRATISNNTFDDPDSAATVDLQVTGPGPTFVTDNLFTDTAVPGDTAVEIADGAGSVTLNRNTATGFQIAVDVGETAGAVAFGSDLLTGNVTALSMTGDVSVENATFWDNSGVDIASTDAHLALDSSIVEDAISDSGAASCAIAFSRGPLIGSGCDAFTTVGDPGFVDPGNGNFHLDDSPFSPMIDAGNPATPTVSRDIDRDLRALDGNGDGACPAERDIGADEFAGTILDCLPPPEPQPQQQPPGDAVPPETLIETGPKGKTKSTSAKFSFTSSEPGSTFECRLDGASFQPCNSPHSVKVKKGSHRIEVRARDAVGNLDPTPAAWEWKVKKKRKKRR